MKIILTIVAALILTPVASSRPVEADCVTDLRAPAIETAATARQIHIDWIERRAKGTVAPQDIEAWKHKAAHRGMTLEAWMAWLDEWDRQWADRYAVQITVFKAARFAC